MLGGFSSAEAQIDVARTDASRSLIDKISSALSDGIHFATPISSLRTNEIDLVRGVLQILQGFSSSLFYWDHAGQSFQAKSGIYVTHLSLKSLHVILNQFMYAATCLKLVEILINKVEKSVRQSPPTLKAFACSISTWLKRLRDVALKEETKISNSNIGTTPTLLGLASGLSSLCSGAEYLLQVVHGAIPQIYFEPNSSVPAAEMATHILDHLYKKLNEVCHMQGGEEEAYQMLLFVFVGSLLPYIEGLDSWLYEGTLDDPCNEMFFYANKTISIDEAEFWEKSYLLRPLQSLDHHLAERSIAGLTLSEIFCVSLVGLIGHGDHISKYFWLEDPCNPKIFSLFESHMDKQNLEKGNGESLPNLACSEKIWFKFLVETSSCPENPVITMCKLFLNKNRDAWRTDYAFAFKFAESEYLRSKDDTKLLEELFPFPTLLPSFQENLQMSELLPFQKNSTLSSRVLTWLQSVELKVVPLPVVIMQECLIVYIKKQVDYIGRHILSKLMNDWRLMDELGVLRAIYLLGSGDLLQHFLTVLFNKLDKGESWDDDFELNTILQESIRNSADGMLLTAPDSLVVSITKHHSLNGDEQHNTASLVSTPRRSRESFGIDGLDLLKFTYKVSWPLELIANTEAIKKYNQVMGFLLKVKRAKFVLDKARRWMWKGRGTATINRKHHWLVEQKLLHFVDAFHQYVMDRVYHSAWRELCEGMAAAGSLDEVIEVHEAYLLSIQRQCFVVPDKLWALIASRINSILGLALDFYSIQQTLSSGGAVSAIKARCEMEVDRIEKQFDDCVAFLLRVLSFKLNVGHFPHLADLVTRINYNYFYMSDSGNLVTGPGSETVTSKLGKAFPV
ncbi:unnamed protein product, partial [Vitis vinifera]